MADPFEAALGIAASEEEKRLRAVQPPAANDFDARLGAVADSYNSELETRLRGTLRTAVGLKPDVVANQRRLAQQTGLPTPTVERNEEEIAKEAYARQVYDQVRASPLLMDRFVNPQFAAVAHDDVEKLGLLEGAFEKVKLGVGAVASATPKLSAGYWNILRAFGENADRLTGGRFGGGIAARAKDEQAGLNRMAENMLPSDPTRGFVENAVYSGLQSLGQNLLTMPLAVLSGTANAALLPMSLGTGGEAYGKASDKGLDPATSLLYGARQGAIEYLTELLPMGRLIGDLKAGTPFMKTVMKQVALEVPGEQLATLLQDLTEWSVLKPDAPFSDYVKERPSAAVSTLISTIVSVGGQTAAATATDMAARRFLGGGLADRANEDVKRLQELLKMAEASKLRERDPQSFRDFVNTAAEGGPLEAVWIRARDLMQVLEQSGTDATVLPQEVREQIADAVVSDSDVRIPSADLLTADSALSQAALPFLKSSPDAMSQEEARVFMQEQAGKLREDAEKVLAKVSQDAATKTEVEQVRQQFVQQLEGAKRWTKDVNEAYAAITTAFVTTTAQRIGMTPTQFVQKYQLNVAAQSPLQPAANTLDQNSPEFRAWFGDSKVVDASGAPLVVYHGTREDFDSFAPRSHFGTKTAANERLDIGSNAGYPRGQRVIPAFLAIRNPLRVSDLQANSDVSLLAAWRDGKIPGLSPQDFPGVNADVMPALEARGFDGLVYQNGTEDAGSDSFVVFRPEQIKSAIGNDGTFDANDPSILSQSMSTRVPTAVKAKENPLAEMLVIGLDAAKADPDAFAKNIALVSKYPNFPANVRTRSPDARAEVFLDEVVKNLLWLYDQVPETTRNRSRLWYDGARAIVDRWVGTYGLADSQLAGVLAVLSPQKDWFMNVSLAERVLDVMTSKQDYAWDDKMSKTAARIYSKPDYAEDVGEITGKRLSELTSPYLKAMWVRAYDETYAPRGYRIVSPEGDFVDWAVNADGKTRSKVAWGSLNEIGKAIAIIEDGSIANISRNLGEQHKVRNFYNNIFDPNDKLGSVTIDTHAVAAALLRPLSGGSLEVLHNFGSGGAASSSVFGAKGTYGIYAEAYRRAAAERGVLPREMQSITWEAVRGLFEARFKGQQRNVDAIDQLWQDYRKGKANLDDTRAAIVERAGGIVAPEWERSGAGKAQRAWPSTYSEELPGAGVSTGSAGSTAGGTGSGVAGILDRVLNQGTTARGQISFAPDITQSPSTITLLKNADLSTFLHELGHFQLEVLAHVASQPNAPAAIVQDMNVLLEWFGIKGDETIAPGAQGGELGQRPLSAPSKVFGRELVPLAKRAYESLSADAQYAVDGWNVNWNTGRLEQAFQEGNDIAQEVEAAFAPVRERIRELYGDTIPMFRGEQKSEADVGRVLFSWTPIRGLGQAFAVNNQRGVPRLISDEEVNAAVEKFNATGYVEFLGNKYIRKDDPAMGPGYYMIYDRSRQPVTDGVDIAADLKREQQDRADWVAELKRRGDLYAAEVPVDSLVWIPVGANLSEPEIIAKYDPRTQSAAVLAQGGDQGTPSELPKRRTPLEVWNAMSLEQKRPYHEQFARGFEAYLFEGKAPNVEMQGIFQRFAAWLKQVYKDIKALNVELTPEVRGVMDRMLASEEAIQSAEDARGFAPLFEQKPDGMTDEEWRAYQELHAGATAEATEELQRRSLRDMQWLTNARGRALAKLQKDAKEKRAAVEAEVRAEVEKEPAYAVQLFIKRGILPDGTQVVGAKLQMKALKEMYGEGPAARWRYLATNLVSADVDGSLTPDTMAEMFGFRSGDHLVNEILNAAPIEQVVEALTDQRMLERYGDISDETALERAADEAVHNEARARFIATELAMLAKATGKPKTLAAAAKAFAEQIIGRKKINDIRPHQYVAAEARAARAAAAALQPRAASGGGKEGPRTDPGRKTGNLTEAATEKRNQLINHYAARAASEGREYVEKWTRRLTKIANNEGTRKNIDPEYLEQIDAILEKYDLRAASQRELQKRASLREWVEKQRAMGLEPEIDEALLDSAEKIHYSTLTLDEFKAMVDGIRNIEHLGRLKKKLLTARDQKEFAAVVEELSTSIADNATGTVKERWSSDRGPLVSLGDIFRRFMAEHRKFASLAREMDGWQDGGKVWERLVRTMNDAGNFEAVEREKATIALGKLLMPVEKGLGKKVDVPAVGRSFTREELLGIALNMGNEVNRERVMSGEKWTTEQLKAVLDPLTAQDWQFVQGVWDYLDTFRPLIGAKQKRVTGIEPDWVEAAPVQTKFGLLRGGYYPIKYDPKRSTRAEADTAAEVQRQIERGLYARAQTRRGHIKERTETTGRPLRYDLSVVTQHVDQVIHDLAWHEFLIDANRLLNAKAIDSAIREHYGPEKLGTMRDLLRDIAVGDLGAQSAGDRVLNHLRHGATIAGLGWNLGTSLLQPIGFTQSIVRIGAGNMLRGIRHWAGDLASFESSYEKVSAKSEFMRLRGKTMQREINEIRNKVSGGDSRLEASYFYLIQKMQLVVDLPTWWGAYEGAMREPNMDESRAVALADQAVIDAQGAGQIKDLAQVQRGSPAWRLFTNFYSFFNTTYNLTREAVGRTRSAADVPGLVVDLALLYTIPALMGTILKAGLSGDWDDEDKLLRRLVADQLNYLLGTVVVLRELGGAVQGAAGLKGADYSGPASVRFFSEVAKLAKQAEQGEADAAFWKALNSTAGILLHYPAGQINKTAEGIAQLASGETQNPIAIVGGKQK